MARQADLTLSLSKGEIRSPNPAPVMAGPDPAIQPTAQRAREARLAGPPVKPGDDGGWGTNLGPTALPNPVSFPRKRESILARKTDARSHPPRAGEHLATPTPDPSPQGGGRRPALGFWPRMVRGSLRSHLTMRVLGKGLPAK
jgi:hypothetical protein